MRGVERITAVAAPRSDDANRGLVVLERTDLDRRGMRAQQDVAGEVEAVLCVERRMIFGKIERVEVVALRFRLRTDGAREPQLAEDVADLVDDLRDNVEPTAPLRAAGHGEIDARQRAAAPLQLELACLDGALELALQRVRNATDAFAFLRIEALKGFEDFSQPPTLAAQQLNFELLKPSFVCVRDPFDTFPHRF